MDAERAERFGGDWVALLKKLPTAAKFYSENQPRDSHGRWEHMPSSTPAERVARHEARKQQDPKYAEALKKDWLLREYARTDRADARAIEKAKAERETPTAHQRQAVYDYGQWGSESINDAFRHPAGRDTSGRDLIAAAFDNPRIYKETASAMTVYRGIADEGVYRSFAHMKIGSVVSDKAPLSTSAQVGLTEKYSGDGGVRLHLDIPRGQRYLTGRVDEHEKILPPGTRFRVTKIERRSGAMNPELNRYTGPRLTIHGKVLR